MDKTSAVSPKVSVIMNCYNSSKYLREAIESVFAQTYENWEIIFWDNASTDGSAEIAKHYSSKLKYFKSDKNVPLGLARNWAIEKSTGKYIAFLDCDDLWITEKLKKQIDLLERNPEIDFVHSNCFVLEMSNGKKKLLFNGKQPEGYVFRQQLANYATVIVTVVIRKTALDKLNSLFDCKLNYAEEYDLFLRLFHKSKIAYIDEPLAIYRIHPQMSTKTIKFEKILDESEYIIEKLHGLEENFAIKYSNEIKTVKSNISFFQARDRLYNLDLKNARTKILPYKFMNIKYFFVFASTYLPVWVWSILSGFRNIVKKIQFENQNEPLFQKQEAFEFDKYASYKGRDPTKMNILFIYSVYNIASTKKPLRSLDLLQFGISYISSYLKKFGHNTKLMVLSRISGKKNKELISEFIDSFKPDIIAFTTTSTEYDFIKSLAVTIKKKYPHIYLVIGGCHVSLNPEGVLEYFDALCIGEGEIPMLELVEQIKQGIKPQGIANLWIKQGEKIEKNQPRPFLQDLDSLPFPDHSIWEEWIDAPLNATPVVLLSRGCVFECSYCSNHALKKLASGFYHRHRSPKNIISEINNILKNSPSAKEIYLEGESIGIDKNWIINLCDELQNFNNSQNTPLTFGANIRVTPDLDLENIFPALKMANFRFINIGLESGSERIRRDVLNRYYTNNDIYNAVRLARENNLKFSFLNMVGLPMETLNDFQETIEMNKKCLPDWTGCSIFFPYPGTKIYSLCQREGLLKTPLTTDMERSRAILDLPNFSRKQIENSYIWFEYNIYKGRKPFMWLLSKVISNKIKADPILFFIYTKLKRLFFSLVSGKE